VQNPVLVGALDRPAFDRTQLCLLEGLFNALDRQLNAGRLALRAMLPVKKLNVFGHSGGG